MSSFCFWTKKDIESDLNDFNIYRFENQRDCEMWAYRRAKAWGTTANRKQWWENFWRNAKLCFTVAGVVLNTWAAITDDKNDAKRAMLSIGGSVLLFLVPLIESNFLTSDQVAERVESRMISQKIKSEMWKSVAGIDIALEEEKGKKRQQHIDQRVALVQRVENTIDMYLTNTEKRLHMTLSLILVETS